MSLTDIDLDLVYDGTTAQTVGMRFAGVAVPVGATITRAYVQFTVNDVTSGTASLTVAGQAADNASAFRAVTGDVSSRPRTTAVGWTPSAWTKRGLNGVDQQTTDLAPVLQEIVSRSAWASGNAVALVVTGTSGSRSAAAFEAGGNKAPVLHIEWRK